MCLQEGPSSRESGESRSGSQARPNDPNQVGEEKAVQRFFIDEAQETCMVGDGQRGAAVGGGKEANERLVRPRRRQNRWH